jgi:hypothetical protein
MLDESEALGSHDVPLCLLLFPTTTLPVSSPVASKDFKARKDKICSKSHSASLDPTKISLGVTHQLEPARGDWSFCHSDPSPACPMGSLFPPLDKVIILLH